MTAVAAWETLAEYARAAGIPLPPGTPPKDARRVLGKRYAPRKASDDNEPMRRINAAVDLLLTDEAVRELCGQEPAPPAPPAARPTSAPPRPAAPARPAPSRWTSQWGTRTGGAATAERPGSVGVGVPVWQTAPGDGAAVGRADYTDLNFIRREIFERSARFGDTELLKAWAWDGDGFRKVVAVQGNDFALEELGRALLYFQTNGPEPAPCRAVFVTRGAGRVRKFQLLLVKMGRLCEDVSKFDWQFEEEPDAPAFAPRLNAWLGGIEATLDGDRGR